MFFAATYTTSKSHNQQHYDIKHAYETIYCIFHYFFLVVIIAKITQLFAYFRKCMFTLQVRHLFSIIKNKKFSR